MSIGSVNNKIQPPATPSTRARYDSGDVRKRPVFLKAWGKCLQDVRDARGWTQSDAVRYAAQKKLTALSRDQLLRLEAGKTKNPEPPLLRSLAALYGLTYEQVVGDFVRFRFGADLVSVRTTTEGAPVAPGPTGGNDNATASGKNPNIREIAAAETRLKRYEIALADIKAAARSIAKLASVRRKGRATARHRTGSGGVR